MAEPILITSSPNPDLDGTGGILAYAELSKKPYE